MKPPARSRAATGGYVTTADRREYLARQRVCPKCEAPVGEHCRDPRSRVYVRPVARAHKERHAART